MLSALFPTVSPALRTVACYRCYLNDPTLKSQSVGDDVLVQSVTSGGHFRLWLWELFVIFFSWTPTPLAPVRLFYLSSVPLPQYFHNRISPAGSAMSQSLSPLFHFPLQNILWNPIQKVRRTVPKTLLPPWPQPGTTLRAVFLKTSVPSSKPTFSNAHKASLSGWLLWVELCPLKRYIEDTCERDLVWK